MMSDTAPQLHAVHSISATEEPDVYLLVIDATDSKGERHDGVLFVARSDDAFGLGPTVQEWLAENISSVTVAPYVPPSIEEKRAALPPITARQLRLGLIANGIMPSQVQAAIEALPAGADREKALVEWEYASSFDRLHPLIASVAAGLSLTDNEIDAMWVAAASL